MIVPTESFPKIYAKTITHYELNGDIKFIFGTLSNLFTSLKDENHI
jgi:hypothetical protein